MTFDQCKLSISAAIANEINHQLLLRGFDVKKLSSLYRELTSVFDDEYSASIFRSGIPKDRIDLLSMTPNEVSAWGVANKFREFFDYLGIPTTQNEAYQLNQAISRVGLTKCLSHTQQERMENLDALPLSTRYITDWFQNVSETLEVLSQRNKDLQKITPEEIDFAKSLAFDWYYNFSDTYSVYEKGLADHKRVLLQVAQALKEKPELRKVVDVICRYRGLPTSFFLGS